MPRTSHHIRRRAPDGDAGQDWRSRAACRPGSGHDPELFFPLARSQYPDIYTAQVEAAKRVCAGCPVVDECLAWAEESGDDGILGGTTPAERRERRANRITPAAAPGSGPGVRQRRVETITQLAAAGMRDAQIARVLGIQRKSVCELRSHHRITAGAKQRRAEQEV